MIDVASRHRAKGEEVDGERTAKPALQHSGASFRLLCPFNPRDLCYSTHCPLTKQSPSISRWQQATANGTIPSPLQADAEAAEEVGAVGAHLDRVVQPALVRPRVELRRRVGVEHVVRAQREAHGRRDGVARAEVERERGVVGVCRDREERVGLGLRRGGRVHPLEVLQLHLAELREVELEVEPGDGVAEVHRELAVRRRGLQVGLREGAEVR